MRRRTDCVSYHPFRFPSPRILRGLHLLPRSQPYIPSSVSPDLVFRNRSERSTLPHPSVFPVPFLCAHGVAGEQVPPEPSSAGEPCTGCAVIRFLGSDPRLLVHLLPAGDRSWIRHLPGTSRRLFPGDPLVGLHCEHLPASTVVRDFEQRTICRLVRMEPPMPSAWDPPLGTV